MKILLAIIYFLIIFGTAGRWDQLDETARIELYQLIQQAEQDTNYLSYINE